MPSIHSTPLATRIDSRPAAADPPKAPSAPAQLSITAVEYAAYRQELDRLCEIRNRELPKRMRHARSFVSADAVDEIAQIQEDQAVVDARISRLDKLLRTSRIVAHGARSDTVSLGHAVTVENLESGKVLTYRVEGGASTRSSGAVSAGSPIGAAIMGATVGDVVQAELPDGRVRRLRILSVGPPEAVVAPAAQATGA